MNLSDIGNAIGGVVSGGLTGLIGIGIQRVFDYKSKQLDVQMQASQFAHEVDMKKADAEIMAQEWSARTQIAVVQAAEHKDTADALAFNTALTSEPKLYSDPTKMTATQNGFMVSLDIIRGLVRPALTLYLAVLTTIVYYQARELIGQNAAILNADQALSVVQLIIQTILYLTTTATLFWFGSRSSQKAPTIKIK